jgi:hypothetical protein
MTKTLVLGVSKRLQPIVAAILCLMVAQLVTASCTPEPVPYASRASLVR